MRKIGLDLRVLATKAYTGIERYTYQLTLELIKQHNEEYYLIGDFRDPILKKAHNIPLDIPRSHSDLANKLLAFKGAMEGLDLLFSPYFSIPERRTFKGVLVIHDLIPLRFPEFFDNSERIYQYFNDTMRKAAETADHLIAVSETTRNDIIYYYNIKPEKITVVPEAGFTKNSGPDELAAIDEVKMKYGVIKPYVLSVCTLEPRKNLSRVLKAYEILRDKLDMDISLVLVGNLGWKITTFLEELENHRYRKDIILTGFIPDADLVALYKNTEVFVYPSLYEGFGLPVLEAMSMGAPVVTSACSSLPEVGGEAAIYCDPYLEEAIADSIEKVITNQVLKDNLIKKGYERAQLFTWENTARQTRDVFLKCLQG